MPWQSIRGHDRVVEELRANLRHGRLPHAFLFVGPEGIGKRTFALALARALLCERNDPDALDPCGRCESCVYCDAGTHPDVNIVSKPAEKHELPIQVIRALCDDLSLKPVRGARKFAIVDDADDLNEEAANAFLKTLEEPPAGSVLILIGQSTDTQLDTVISRCRVVRFEPLTDDDVAAILLEHKQAESREQALRLARRGEGSVTRALGFVDPAFEVFRRDLFDLLAAPEGFDPVVLASRMHEFIKDAGKESVAQRARARLIFGEAARFFRSVLWQTAGLEPPSHDAGDRAAIAALAARLEPETVFLLADRCLEGDRHIERRAHVPLVLDAWSHDVAKSLAASSA
ncbi:MAG: DNA polymerase III subunit delta' [Planctomycetota bacterium]|nr:DNA polymerase III subunit delta' [Planctomycetota bacterium]